MKVTATDTPSVKVLGYPKLMVSDDGQIVLMGSYGAGVVVRCAPTVSPVGFISRCWAMSCFKDYTGTVTLENS